MQPGSQGKKKFLDDDDDIKEYINYFYNQVFYLFIIINIIILKIKNRQTLFKPPSRTALIESKKEQWIHELANGTVPLRKLACNVPHGYKGEKLLETLAARQVPFLRATWYIKIVGLSEMVTNL